MSAARARALQTLVEPVVARFGCDLEQVVIRPAGSRRLVRIVLDHDGGLPLDLVAEVSGAISRALDESDVLGESAYVLEVTSPGVDRPLSLPRHWRRAVGRLVHVTPVAGEEFVGRVIASDAGSAQLDVDGQVRAVPHDSVARAVVQVEFSRVDEVDLGGDDDEDPGEA